MRVILHNRKAFEEMLDGIERQNFLNPITDPVQ
jgi:hypothetical protein